MAIRVFLIFFVIVVKIICCCIKKMARVNSNVCILTAFLLQKFSFPRRLSSSVLRVKKLLAPFILTKKRNGRPFACTKERLLKKLEPEYIYYNKNWFDFGITKN